MSSVKREQHKLQYPLTLADYKELLDDVYFIDETMKLAPVFSDIVDLVEGDNEIIHTLATAAKFVTFFESGKAAQYGWKRGATPDKIIVTGPEGGATGIEINII